MKEKAADPLMKLTIAAAIVIVAVSVAVVCLYRFKAFPRPKPTEKRIAQNLDLNDPHWIETLIEISLPSYKKDFSLYSVFSASGGMFFVTQVFATRAGLDEIRTHYRELLDNPRLPENNGAGVLELSGEIKNRKVTIMNFFSEISNLISVEMEMPGEDAALIWQKINGAFPARALAEAPQIAAFAGGESTEGYVMYNYDTFATDVYPNVPIFSRAYPFNGTLEELENKINALGDVYKNSAVIFGGIAEIKYSLWLYQVKALESLSGVKAALIIQEIPKK